MANELEFSPEEKLFLLYLLDRNRNLDKIIKDFKDVIENYKKERLMEELNQVKASLISGKRKIRNGKKIDLKEFALSQGRDIFELSKLLVKSNIPIENGLVDSYTLDVLLGNEKERILPANKGNLEVIFELTKDKLNLQLWTKLVSNYNLVYGDADWPNYEGMLQTLNKPKMKFDKKPKIIYKGVLAKRIYEEYQNHINIEKLAKKFSLSEETIKEFLKKFGVLSREFIGEELSNLESIAGKSIIGLKVYTGKLKQKIRESELEISSDYFNDKKIKYLGLEGNNFISYILFATSLNLIPEKSLIPERDEKKANIMSSIVENNELINNGEIFKGLNIYKGELIESLEDKKFIDMRFNLLNLDYEGGWSSDKEETIKLLFDKDKLENHSFIFMTLNDTAMERIRVIKSRGKGLKGYNTTNQYKIVHNLIMNYAQIYGFDVKELFRDRYSDRVHSMMAFGFKLKK